MSSGWETYRLVATQRSNLQAFIEPLVFSLLIFLSRSVFPALPSYRDAPQYAIRRPRETILPHIIPYNIQDTAAFAVQTQISYSATTPNCTPCCHARSHMACFQCVQDLTSDARHLPKSSCDWQWTTRNAVRFLVFYVYL